MLSRFSDAMALTEIEEGRFRCSFDRSWWVVVGPNGGIIAGLLVRAAEQVAPGRWPRTLTVHYVRPPTEGEAELVATVDQAGRSVTFVSVRLYQDGRLLASALVALTAHREPPMGWEQRTPPASAPLEEAMQMRTDEGVDVPIRARWDQAWTLGVPSPDHDSAPSARFEAGGWMRLTDPEPYSAALLAAMADAWVPAVMVHTDDPVHTPTLELTIHFRADVRGMGLRPEDYVLAHFRQLSAHEGFLDESGEIWTADGRLLVMCRQLGLVLPREGGAPTAGRRFVPRS